MALTARGPAVAWVAALLLYAVCWVLPILVDGGTRYIGYDGAVFAHQLVWELVSGERALDLPGEIFFVLFTLVGWLANELFLLGVALVAFGRHLLVAVRLLAAALGIMLSWQVAFIENFPLLIGYWCWVAAGALALYLAARLLAAKSGRNFEGVLSERATIALVALPIVNAAFAHFADRF